MKLFNACKRFLWEWESLFLYHKTLKLVALRAFSDFMINTIVIGLKRREQRLNDV